MNIYTKQRLWWRLGRRRVLTRIAGDTLEELELGNQNLPGAYLREAVLRHTNLCFSNLAGADLARADLTGALLGRTFLADADLREAILEEADLGGATLSRARLGGARLVNANLKGAILADASLCGADLRGANLENVRLGQVELKAARYDSRTRWPQGFDPEAAGAVEAESTESPGGLAQRAADRPAAHPMGARAGSDGGEALAGPGADAEVDATAALGPLPASRVAPAEAARQTTS